MSLYDVGMTSLVCMELQALATLAITAFDPPRLKDHEHLMARLTELSNLLTTNLWDNQTDLFVNRHVNGTWIRRISPTSFYPLLAGLATEDQARSMMDTLKSPDGFCVSQTVSNTPCTSIPRLFLQRQSVASLSIGVVRAACPAASGLCLANAINIGIRPCILRSRVLERICLGPADTDCVLGIEKSTLPQRERGADSAQGNGAASCGARA
jgi:hypothetical protein